MRVLIVYMFCTNGGVETALKNRVKNILPTEIEIDLLFLKDYGGTQLFDAMPHNVFIESDFGEIMALIHEKRYDAVISIDTPSILELLHEIGYKGVVGLEVHTTYEYSLQYLRTLPYNFLSFVIVPSQYQKQIVNQYINQNLPILVLPNSLDTSLFKPIELKTRNKHPIIAWVGRLDEHKNWEKFVEIAHHLSIQHQSKLEFWLIGGMHTEDLQLELFFDKQLKNNLQASFRWLPYVPYDHMPLAYSYIAASGGCYITTSNNESFGMTVIEAMACGCPTICNNVGALPELTGTMERGLLLDMTHMSNKEISAKMIDFLSEPQELCRVIKNALEYTNQFYNEDVVGAQYVNILSKYLGNSCRL